MPSGNSPIATFRSQALPQYSGTMQAAMNQTHDNGLLGGIGEFFGSLVESGEGYFDKFRQNFVSGGNFSQAGVFDAAMKSGSAQSQEDLSDPNGTAAQKIAGVAMSPLTGLDYSYRASNAGIGGSMLLAESGVATALGAQETSAVPWLRDGADGFGEITSVYRASFGDDVQETDQYGNPMFNDDGSPKMVLNSVTAFQGISTFVGRSATNVVASINPAWRDTVDKWVIEESNRNLADPGNSRGLYGWNSGLYSEFDIFNYKERESAYNQGLGRWITGIGDAAIYWFVGPEILAAKAAGYGGRSLFTQSIESFTDVNRMTRDLAAHEAFREGVASKTVTLLDGTVEDVAAKRTSVGQLADSLTRLDELQVSRHKIATASDSPNLVARVLGNSTDYKAVSTALRAFAGDMKAVDELYSMDAIAAGALALKREAIDRTKEALAYEGMKPRGARSWGLDESRLTNLQKEYDAALKEKQALRDAISSETPGGINDSVWVDNFSLSKLQFGPNSVARMESKAVNAADRAAGLPRWADSTYYTGDGFGRFIRVVRSGMDYLRTSRAIGIVHLNDDLNVRNEVDAIFETTPMLRRLQRMGGEAMLPGTNMRVSDFREGIHSDLINARSAQERWIVMDRMDKTLTASLAAHYNVGQREMKEIVDKYSTMRKGLHDQVERHGWFEDGGAIHAVPDHQAMIREFNMQSTQAEKYMTSDFDFLETAMRLEQGSGARLAGKNLAVSTDRVFSAIDSVWRPLVLMRLGYTQRNVAEGWMRELAAFGTIGALKQRRMGESLAEDSGGMLFWGSLAGRTLDRIGYTVKPLLGYGTVRKSIKNLNAQRNLAVESATDLHGAQQRLAANQAATDELRDEILRNAQAERAQGRIDELNELATVNWDAKDSLARGHLTDVMDRAEEFVIPSTSVRPLLSIMGKQKRRAKTAQAFETRDQALEAGVNDGTIPAANADEYIGVASGDMVDTAENPLKNFMNEREAAEFDLLTQRAMDGGLEEADLARFGVLQDKAYRRAATKAMQQGDKVVRIVDSGLYQAIHSPADIAIDDILSGNLAIIPKANFNDVTHVRAMVAGRALDLRFTTNTDEVMDGLTGFRNLLVDGGIDPEMREIRELDALIGLAEADPQVLEAIAMNDMVRKLPTEMRDWFRDNGLLMQNKAIKNYIKGYFKTDAQRKAAAIEIENRVENMKQAVRDFPWDEYAAMDDLIQFHGGTRMPGDTMKKNPINNVADSGAVYKGIGFYTTENPDIAIEYVINRAMRKDGEVGFVATVVDPNSQKFMDLDEVVSDYETEDEMRYLFERMHEKFGGAEDETDAAFTAMDDMWRESVANREFTLGMNQDETVQFTRNEYRKAYVDYFREQILNGKTTEAAWNKAEYKAQRLWTDTMKDEGFDGVRHMGTGAGAGGVVHGEHNVYIFYKKQDLIPLEDVNAEAEAIRELQRRIDALELKYIDQLSNANTLNSRAQYEASGWDASTMTKNQERIFGKMMNDLGYGRVYVRDSRSPSGFRLIVNPDSMSVNTDSLDAVLPGAVVGKQFDDRMLEQFQTDAAVRSPFVFSPAGRGREGLLQDFDGDEAVVNFLLTGKGSTPEIKARVARYMENREQPFTHLQVGKADSGKFVSVSEMLGGKKVGASYAALMTDDETTQMATYLAANNPRMQELLREGGELRAETFRAEEAFNLQAEKAEAAAAKLKERIGKRKSSGAQRKKKMGSGREQFKRFEWVDEDGVVSDKVAGVFHGDNQGALNAVRAGSDARVEMELFGFSDRTLSNMQRMSKSVEYAPNNKLYWTQFAHELNTIWRNDPVGELLIQGKTTNEIFATLGETKRGRAWIRDVGGVDDYEGLVSRDMLDWDSQEKILSAISDREAVLSKLIPGDASFRGPILERIAKGDVDAMWLRTNMGWRTDLANIEGFGYSYELGKWWRKSTAHVMRALGTVPENNLVRHPFYRARWREMMQKQIDFYGEQKAAQATARGEVWDGMFTAADVNAMNLVAKKRALKQVNNTLYTIERLSTPAHMLRFVAPFFPAWASSMKFWLLRMPVEKPETIVRYGMAFNAPVAMGMMKDENGNTIRDTGEGNGRPQFLDNLWSKVADGNNGQIVVQMSPGIAEKMSFLTQGQSTLSVSRGSLDVLLQGEHFWVPGLGPLVSLPASWLASQRPDWATSLQTGQVPVLDKFIGSQELVKALYESVLPFGPSKEKDLGDLAAETFLPAWGARQYSKWRGTDSASFSNAAMTIYQQSIIDWELAGRQGEQPNFEKAVSQAQDFFNFRSLVSLVAPFAPGFSSKYKFYIDEWRRIERKAYDTPDGSADPESEFITKYGTEFFAATQSLSARSSGVSSSVGEFKEIEGNKELYGGLASLGDDASYMTMASRPYAKAMNEDGFDPAVYAWQYNRNVAGASGKFFRSGAEQRTDMFMDVDKETGWYLYDKQTQQAQALYESGQLSEENYNTYKRMVANTIGATYKNWYEDFKDIGGSRYITSVAAMDQILGNDQYMTEHQDDTYVQALYQFNSARDQLVQTLLQRAAQGGTDNPTAKQNADIVAAYNAMVKNIGLYDTTGEFNRMFKRFFSGDSVLKPIPGRDF